VKQGRSWIGLAGRLIICALLLTWICHGIFLKEGEEFAKTNGLDWERFSRTEQWRQAWAHGPGELWRTVQAIPPGVFGLSLFWMGLTIVLGVVRWRVVLAQQGIRLTFGRAAGITLVAQFFNSFLLGSSGGDLVKALYAARETHHQKTEAVVAVFVDRLVGLWAMLLFAGIMMVPNVELIRSDDRLEAVCGVILMMLAAGSAFLGVAFWSGLSKQLPAARKWLRKVPKGAALERSLDACRSFGRDPVFLVKALGISMLLNAACVVQFITIARGLELDVPVGVLAMMVPMVICIAALPITPSGLGVRENLFVQLLGIPLIAASAKLALALSLLAFAGSLAWSLAGGGVYLFMKQRQHLDEVTRGNSEAQ
jgi:uncharacterized protein (TIRG00374 family)